MRGEDPPGFLLKWGAQGVEDGQFDTPAGIAVDSSGSIYVADYLNYRVQKFTADGVFLTKWGTYRPGPGYLSLPSGIAIDRDGTVYVAERGRGNVLSFTPDGEFLDVVWEGPWGLVGIAIDGDDKVYVTCPYVHRVYKLTNTGVPLTSWGAQGTGNGEFELPAGIAVDAAGFVYVTDSINNCVQKFTSEGQFVGRWSGDELYEPSAIAVDATRHVYVTTAHHRILKFTSDGGYLSMWGTNAGTGDGQFTYPSGIAIAGRFVYVVDGGNHRIQKFGYPVAVEPHTWGHIKATYR